MNRRYWISKLWERRNEEKTTEITKRHTTDTTKTDDSNEGAVQKFWRQIGEGRG
jgi:hypothetical protein